MLMTFSGQINCGRIEVEPYLIDVKDNLLDCKIDNGWILFLNKEILGKPLKKGYSHRSINQ